jgi:pimeloyl-ACP methyl ester carboxylesterase
MFATVSTPTSLDLPDGVERTTIRTSRGSFAALEAVPVPGACERDTALLIPGYTGSKEDFLAILDQLAAGGRRVFAIDMRGQYETPGTDDPDGYSVSAVGSDILAVIRATGARHVLGHSYGGLIAREAVLANTGLANTGLANTGLANTGLANTGLANTGLANTEGRVDIGSLTLMSSGPGTLGGPRAEELRAMLAALGVESGDLPDKPRLQAGIAAIWQAHLEPQAVAEGVTGPVLAFLTKRMKRNDPNALVLVARYLLSAPDRTVDLARLSELPTLVLYGENDNAWSPRAQENMARRLRARRVCIPGAAHSPAVEAPATTASALTAFWEAAEGKPTRPTAATRSG